MSDLIFRYFCVGWGSRGMDFIINGLYVDGRMGV